MEDFEYDFGGYATKNDLRCQDGRVIRKDAFKDCDGKIVPLVWNHKHDGISNVLGHALLRNRKDGVYAYCKLNDTENGKDAREMVKNRDLEALSIWANNLKESGKDVLHGVIREVSLVLAGCNPGALIDDIMIHSENDDGGCAEIYCNQPLFIAHSADEPQEEPEVEPQEEVTEEVTEETQQEEEPEVNNEELQHSAESEQPKAKDPQAILDSMTEEQKELTYALVGQALASKEEEPDEDEGGKEMKHNAFDAMVEEPRNVISHADQAEILGLAKSSSVGSLQKALAIYAEESGTLAHGIDDIETLFPEYKDVLPVPPELITRDMTWVGGVMSGVHKSPISRIRTRQANAKIEALKAKGYKKGEKKKLMDNINLISRTTDPQTVYVKDKMERDDILDITDFDVVEYNYKVMKMVLEETLAMAIMVGDQRDDSDPDKIKEDHIRPIWTDHNFYTMHKDVDLAAAKATLQGTNTNMYFSENYIYAEAIIEAALYAREQYKGSGNVTFYCDPHLVNVMLLARDRNGRRIYDTVSDLAAALNVTKIETAEQFAGLKRTTSKAKGDATDGDTKQLLGIFVNLKDYQLGSTKGGEITRFNQFDIDYNQEKYLIETRLSGALTRIQSAIALEMPVVEVEDEDDELEDGE